VRVLYLCWWMDVFCFSCEMSFEKQQEGVIEKARTYYLTWVNTRGMYYELCKKQKSSQLYTNI
jgi:hypothetical protein